MSILRGLLALIFITTFQTTLLAEYLYKDDVVQNPMYNEKIEAVGKELYEKTGIALKLVMVRDLPVNTDIAAFQKQILDESNDPTILLVFVELSSLVDITVNDTSLYKYFNRDQVLSPVASMAQAIVTGIFFADSFEHFFQLVSNSGGTILPLLGAKAKEGKITDKYAAAMFNGYVDIAGQIGESKGVILENAKEHGGKYILTVLKTVFYGIILWAIYMYIRRELYKRRNK